MKETQKLEKQSFDNKETQLNNDKKEFEYKINQALTDLYHE